jgi:chromosome segregation ATPase
MLIGAMRNRFGVVVLVLLCLALGVALITIKKQAADQQHQDTETIGVLSNKWVKTSADWEEQRQVTAMVEKDLDTQKKAFGELSNNYSQVSGNLIKTEASLKASQEQVTRLETKTAELETQNQALDKQAVDLSAALTNLTTQIADTQKKLAASEGNKAFLEKELNRLMSEKAELEKQFNDLGVLRAQVSKLKEELSIARRIEWIRQGIFASAEQKGGQKLMQGLAAPQAKAPPKSNFDLNVEINADGSVRVIPPQTNGPAAANPPPR